MFDLRFLAVVASTIPYIGRLGFYYDDHTVLPHYASARFWPARFAELLSVLLLFVALYALLRAARPACPPLRSFAWGIDIQRWRLVA